MHLFGNKQLKLKAKVVAVNIGEFVSSIEQIQAPGVFRPELIYPNQTRSEQQQTEFMFLLQQML